MAGKNKGTGEEGEKKESSKMGAAIFIVLLLLIWISGFALLIKLDIGSLGTTLRPFLKDVPVLSLVLPAVSEEQLAYEENYPYTSMEEAIAKIDELQAQIDALTSTNEDDTQTIAELQAEVDRLQVFEDEQLAFEQRVADFDENVVFNAQRNNFV